MLVLQWRWGGLALCALALPLLSAAQGSRPATGIYSCVDAQGRRLTSDRPIPACVSREQRVLNSDGSVQRVLPPTLTAEERAERDAAERKAELARAAQADAVRRDRNLMARFPDEAAHHKARRWHLGLYQAMSAAFTPQYQSHSRALPALRDRVLSPMARLWPLPRILTALVSGDLLPPIAGSRFPDA